jgi:hypothetical protein
MLGQEAVDSLVVEGLVDDGLRWTAAGDPIIAPLVD